MPRRTMPSSTAFVNLTATRTSPMPDCDRPNDQAPPPVLQLSTLRYVLLEGLQSAQKLVSPLDCVVRRSGTIQADPQIVRVKPARPRMVTASPICAALCRSAELASWSARVQPSQGYSLPSTQSRNAPATAPRLMSPGPITSSHASVRSVLATSRVRSPTAER